MLTPLLIASVESALNYLLYRDDALKAGRLRLAGRVLKIALPEFNVALYLSFYEQGLSVQDSWQDPVDCVVTTNISVLAQWRDNQPLAALIRRGDLNVEGDLQVVQQFVALLELVEWDVAELLAPYTGDIVAQEVSTRVHHTVAILVRRARQQRDSWAQAITEEWRLAPSALEVAGFCEEVGVLERQSALLERRLTTLEGRP